MSNAKDLTVGQRIRNFRTRAGVSQFNLEMEIGAAPGSLSRIEQGAVNPTKETLVKVVEALDLKSFEAASLFSLEFDEIPKMVELAKKLNNTLDLDKLLQDIVNEVVYDLDLFGSMIFLCDDETMYVKGLTQTWYTKLVFDLLPAPLTSLKTSRKDNPDNIVVKTINDRKIYFTKYIRDASHNIIPDWISDFVQRVNGTKYIVMLPLIADDKVVGCVGFSKDKEENFDLELDILKTLADYIAVAIVNAQNYSKLQEEIKALKDGKQSK